MGALKITFELSDDDLKHFQRLLREAKGAAREAGEAEVCARADELLVKVRGARVPGFIAERMEALAGMLALLRDEEFALEPELRKPVVTALAYFADPDDLIPDEVPGLGFLDDAIMIELVLRELAAELETYRRFCAAREEFRAARGKGAKLDRAEFLEEQRKRLFDRLRQRRRRGIHRRGDASDRDVFGR